MDPAISTRRATVREPGASPVRFPLRLGAPDKIRRLLSSSSDVITACYLTAALTAGIASRRNTASTSSTGIRIFPFPHQINSPNNPRR
jgi:hypothetical protein